MSPYKLECGNSKELLKTLADNSIDAIVTDPPYELGFMGKKWDASGIAYDVDLWRECLRVLKPGGHLLAFSGSRTYHRMTVAIEDAGFEIRDQILWLYGSGFPKSHNVSKAIDKIAGAEREVVGIRQNLCRTKNRNDSAAFNGLQEGGMFRPDRKTFEETAPATDAAKEWNGWGTALKPAHEPICVARKPLIGTVAENVLTHGTGAINVDACRVISKDWDKKTVMGKYRGNNEGNNSVVGNFGIKEIKCTNINSSLIGRWPANIIHDGSAEVLAGFPETQNSARPNLVGKKYDSILNSKIYGKYQPKEHYSLHDDKGSAARFFYCAKASKKDRDEGLDGFEERDGGHYAQDDWSRQNMGNTPDAMRAKVRNHHPTVKPTELMRYLCRLVTPPNGVILDPFLGSGSTGKAAIYEGFQFVGFDLSAEYVEISRARIEYAMQKRNEISKQKENTLFEE